MELFVNKDVALSISTAVTASCSPDDLVVLFNSSCLEILDAVAPLRHKRSNFKSKVWLDDNARSLRQACRRAERRWKKDHLTVSFEMFMSTLSSFQSAAKVARAKHFSNIIN